MKDTKRILFITNTMDLGGAPLLLLSFIKWLKSNTNHKMIIIAPQEGSLLCQFEDIIDVIICDFKYDKDSNKTQRFFNYFRNKLGMKLYQHKKVINYIKKNNFDLIYSNTIHNNFILNIIKKNIKVTTLIHAHEARYVMTVEDRNGNSLAKSLIDADKIIAVSRTTYNALGEQYNIAKNKIKIVKNGINFKLYKQEGKNNARNKIGISLDKTIVLGVGQPHWIKGCDLFIQVANQMNEKKDDILFLWIGGNEDNPFYLDFKYEIKKLNASNYIKLIPNTNNMNLYYESSDIVLISSREESFSLVTIEAGYFKKPIICFDKSGGPAELIKKYGFTVPYLNTTKVSDKIIDILENKTPIQQKLLDFYDKIEHEHNEINMFHNLLKLINEE